MTMMMMTMMMVVVMMVMVMVKIILNIMRNDGDNGHDYDDFSC